MEDLCNKTPSKTNCIDAIVKNNKKIRNKLNIITLRIPKIVKTVLPGQFFLLNCGESTFLPRPYSVHDFVNNTLVLLVKQIGPGSVWLSKRKPGDKLKILGPLGNGYNVKIKNSGIKNILMIAGGTGVASLHYLAKWFNKNNKEVQLNFIIGAKTKNEIVKFNDIRLDIKKMQLCTDDGSVGYCGLPTVLLKDRLKSLQPDIIYSCGPRQMLKSVSEIATKNDVRCQVSLEEYMACGLGACRGCVTKVYNSNNEVGYKSVCSDGPVFNAQQIMWDINRFDIVNK